MTAQLDYDDDIDMAFVQYGMPADLVTSGAGTTGHPVFSVDLGSFPNGLFQTEAGGGFTVTRACTIRATYHFEAICSVANGGWIGLFFKNNALVPFSGGPNNARATANESDMAKGVTVIDMAAGDTIRAYLFVKEANPFLGTAEITLYARGAGTVPQANVVGTKLLIEAIRSTAQ